MITFNPMIPWRQVGIFTWFLVCLLFLELGLGQIGIGTTTPNSKAVLDIFSTDKGILIPRLTNTQRNAIISPPNGLLIYNADVDSFQYWNGVRWVNLIAGSSSSTYEIVDADGDTKVQVERSAGGDQDSVFIFTGDAANNSTLYWRFGKGRMEVLNTGASVFIGTGAGANEDLNNRRNVFIGDSAGKNTNTGYQNVFIGFSAGKSNTYGFYNVFIGAMAGNSNTNGSMNVFIGTGAGQSNTTGERNTFLGRLAGSNNTTGDENVYIGYAAGPFASPSTGSRNVFIGVYAGIRNTTGTDNVFVGYSAGYNETSGSDLVAIGNRAMHNKTEGVGSIGVGSYAGSQDLTGSYNVFLGYNANPTVGNLTNAIAIGYQAQVGCSNCMVLGGTGTNAVNVGIGTTNPTERLEVVGNVMIPDTNDYQYSAPKTHYLSLPGIAFKSENATAYEPVYASGYAFVPTGSPGSAAYLLAPIHLPDGATITKVDFLLEDNSTTNDFLFVQIFAKDLNTGSTSFESITPPTGTYTIQPVAIFSFPNIPNPVDNQNYAYYLRLGTWQNDPDLKVHGVRITYTVTKVD